MDIEQFIPARLWREYYEQFGQPIPIGAWHTQEDARRAEHEARRAIAGERGPLMSDEFPMDYPPGVEA